MTFCIITHVVHIKKDGHFYGYAPYVNEMNIWLKYVDKVIIVAPLKNIDINSIHNFYSHPNIEFVVVPEFSLLGIVNIFKTLFFFPVLFYKIVVSMSCANHIHLRCPGNMGLLASFAQILFPFKKKTAKYAGNWDVKSKQPFTYNLQKSILSNTFLTRNMKVLVYGKWANQSKNVYPFFTATYRESQIESIKIKDFKGIIKFIFVGTLSKGKQPQYAIDLVKNLYLKGYNVTLEIYGDGILKNQLESYIVDNKCEEYINLKGNVTKENMILNYQNSHFLILPSLSEGWPKVVAEAMFWGCLPIATSVSCVDNMLDNQNRGIILNLCLQDDTKAIIHHIDNYDLYQKKINAALSWSHLFTIDKFEQEIKKMLE